MKVKDLLDFLESTDPDCDLVIKFVSDRGIITTNLNIVEDDGVGTIALKGDV